jgi:hypothetical protein
MRRPSPFGARPAGGEGPQRPMSRSGRRPLSAGGSSLFPLCARRIRSSNTCSHRAGSRGPRGTTFPFSALRTAWAQVADGAVTTADVRAFAFRTAPRAAGTVTSRPPAGRAGAWPARAGSSLPLSIRVKRKQRRPPATFELPGLGLQGAVKAAPSHWPNSSDIEDSGRASGRRLMARTVPCFRGDSRWRPERALPCPSRPNRPRSRRGVTSLVNRHHCVASLRTRPALRATCPMTRTRSVISRRGARGDDRSAVLAFAGPVRGRGLEGFRPTAPLIVPFPRGPAPHSSTWRNLPLSSAPSPCRGP